MATILIKTKVKRSSFRINCIEVQERTLEWFLDTYAWEILSSHPDASHSSITVISDSPDLEDSTVFESKPIDSKLYNKLAVWILNVDPKQSISVIKEKKKKERVKVPKQYDLHTPYYKPKKLFFVTKDAIERQMTYGGPLEYAEWNRYNNETNQLDDEEL